MLTPSSNTEVEPLTMAMLASLGPEATAHFSRFRVTSIGLGDEQLAQFRPEPMLAAAALLADAGVDVIAWNGTSGSWLGIGADRDLCHRIEVELGTKATTATLATLDAFHAYGVRRYGLVVPYTLEVTERMIETYRTEGFECLAEEHLGLSRNVEFAEVPPSQIAEMVRAVAPGADAVAIVCTNLHSAPLVAELERSLGIPIVDSLAATVWRSLDLASPGNSVFGWGGLAASGALRSRFQPIMEKLLEATGAGRTTIRLDLTRHGLSVDRVAGEAHRQGIRSIRQDGSLDQWAMPTVHWLNNHHDILVQNDVASDSPPVTPALIEVYGVRAQMLGPLLVKGQMLGWISVHEVGAPRQWTGREISALDQACRAAVAVIEAPGSRSATTGTHV
jgi:maleate isomerase